MIRTKVGVAAGLLLALSAATACTTSRSEVPAGRSPGPALAVERFLQAANANELETMMELFGTSNRTIEQLDGRSMAERRMHLLSSLLRHDDFAIRGQRSVPGRLYDAATVDVDLQKGARTLRVPFTVVRRSGGGWIIEQVDVEAITNPS